MASTAYGYDAASRLQTVDTGTNLAVYNYVVYNYVANSPLVGQIGFYNNGALRMTTTKQYDYLKRLTAIQSSEGASQVSSFNYAYNSANQRTQVTNTDSSYWVYQYDNLGQVISGKKYWSSGTPVAGQQFTYNFDNIGNRESTASGGDATGANLRSANYSANNLNQYTSRDVPGYVTVLGSANPNATVTVNLQRAVRQGSYFWDELSVGNGSSSQYVSLTNLAVLNNGTNADIVATNVGNVFVPQTPETFGYDADGNMTNSGRWTITWDAENRAVSFASPASAPTASMKKVDCAYDWEGRRIQKIVPTNNGSTWIPVSTNMYVYDGWNLIAILNPQAAELQSFTWGADLSGTQQGAGGVGGLLSMAVYSGTNAESYFYGFDGNGNVSALINVANDAMSAQYEYGPFGEVIRSTRPMAMVNPFRFSTKYQDDETGLNYYGYRYYDLSSGRWANRDFVQEVGGVNLYCMTGNDPITHFDVDGLWGTDQHHEIVKNWLARNPPPDGQVWSHYKWHCLYVDVLSPLQEGSDNVDGVGPTGGFCDAQASENSYQHSMRAWYQSVAAAQSKRDASINQKEVSAVGDAVQAEIDLPNHKAAAQYLINLAIIETGEAAHPVEDDTSAPHHGFQVWFGPLDGCAILGPVGYAAFVLHHHERETKGVYDKLDADHSVDDTVAAKMHPVLLRILQL